MIKQVFTVYDSKAEMYMPPFMAFNKGEAIRSFSDAAKDPKSMIYAHPEDYTLFHIGEYDDNTAKYIQPVTNVSLGVAIEYALKIDYTPKQDDVNLNPNMPISFPGGK